VGARVQIASPAPFKMRKTGPTNLRTRKLISKLEKLYRKKKVKLWKRLMEEFLRPRRKRREVNIIRINKHTKENETVVVPGKVLSVGELDHKVVVAALEFSKNAMEKINKIGKAITIEELIEKNPEGKNIKLIG